MPDLADTLNAATDTFTSPDLADALNGALPPPEAFKGEDDRRDVVSGILHDNAKEAATALRWPAYPVPDQERYGPVADKLDARLAREAPWLPDEARGGMVNEFRTNAAKVAQASAYEGSLEDSRQSLGFIEGQKGIYRRFAEHGGVIPFAGKLGDLADAMQERDAKARMEAGQARDEDVDFLAHRQAMKEVIAGRTTGQSAADLAAGMPSFLAEWAALTPLAAPARGWAEATTARYLAPSAARWVAPLTGAAAAGAARTVGNVPEAAIGVEQKMTEGQPFGGALARTLRDEFITNTVFEGLHPFRAQAGDAAWKRIGKGLASALGANEAAADLRALGGWDQAQSGPLWRLANARSDDEREKAWRDVKSQVVVFGGLETLLNARGRLRDAVALDAAEGVHADPDTLQHLLFGGWQEQGRQVPGVEPRTLQEVIGQPGPSQLQPYRGMPRAEPYTPPPQAPPTETTPAMRHGQDIPLTRSNIEALQLRRQMQGLPPATPEEVVGALVSNPEQRHYDTASGLMADRLPVLQDLEEQMRRKGLNPDAVARRVETSGATSRGEWYEWSKKNRAYPGDDLRNEYAAMLAMVAGKTGQVPKPGAVAPGSPIAEHAEAAKDYLEPELKLWGHTVDLAALGRAHDAVVRESTPAGPADRAALPANQGDQTAWGAEPGVAGQPADRAAANAHPPTQPGAPGPATAPARQPWGAPAKEPAASGSGVLTPRQHANALEAEHNAAQKRLVDAQAGLEAAKSWLGKDRDEQVKAARAEVLAARKAIGGSLNGGAWSPGLRPAKGSLADRLDEARIAAAAQEAPQRPPSPWGPQPPPAPAGAASTQPERSQGPSGAPLSQPAQVWKDRLAGMSREEMVATLRKALWPEAVAGRIADELLGPQAPPASIEDAFDRGELSEREQHVIREGLKRRTLADIAGDDLMAKAGGGKLTEERIRQIATEGLDKLAKVAGKEKAGFSINDLFKSGKADLAVNDVEEGREAHQATAEELHGRPEGRGRVRKRQARLDNIDRRLEALADEYTNEKEKSGGKLSDEREAEYRAKFTRLDQARAGRHPAAPAPAGEVPEGRAGQAGAGWLAPGREQPGAGLAGRTAPGAAGEPGGSAADDLTGRELLDVRAEARRRLAFAEQEAGRQAALRRRLIGELRKFGNVMSDKRLDALSARDRNSVKGLDDLAHSYSMNEPELFGSDGTEAADRIFEFLTGPRPEAPTFEELEQRVAAEHLRMRESRREEEAGRGGEPEGAVLPAATEVEPGVLFHSSLRTPAKHEPVSRERAADILRSGRPTPELTAGQRSLLEDHLLRGKSLNSIARERGVSSSAASQTFNIALRNLGAPEAPPNRPAAFSAPAEGRKYRPADLLRRLGDNDRPPEVTKRQWELMREVHLNPGKSLGDIGARWGISKQAVHIAVTKGWARLAPFVEEPGRGEVVEAGVKGGLTPTEMEGMQFGSAGESHARPSYHEAMADHIANLIMGETDDAKRQQLLDDYHAVVEEGLAGNDRGPALAAATRRYGQETPAVLYHTPGRGAAAAGAGGTGPGPFEVNATIDKPLDVANQNVKWIPQNRRASAATLMHEQSVMTTKLAAGDPEVRLEEAAHVIAGRMRLEVDPTQLPLDVAKGFQQWFNPSAPMNPTTMHEGFGQWMVARARGAAGHGTPEMQAAAQYAEDFVKRAGLTQALDRVGDAYRKYAGQTEAGKYAGTISQTGRPAEPVGLTAGEKASTTAATFLQRLQERVENAKAVLGRMYDDAVSKGMPAKPKDEQAMNVALAFQHQAGNWAKDLAEHGIPEVQPDGSWKPVTPGTEHVFRRITTEEQRPGGAFDTFAKAREAADVYQREELAAQAALRAGRKPEPPTVTPDQFQEALRVLREMLRADPDQFQRFEATNQERAAALTQGLKLLEQVGFLPPGKAAEWGAKNPYYLSRERVFDQETEDYLSQQRGPARQGQPGFTKARSLSGEQTRGAVETFRERIADLANLVQRQLHDAPIRGLLRQKGMGEWAREMPSGREKNAAGETIPREPDDETKPVWRSYENGKDVRFMLKDASLRDYLLRRQADSSRIAQLGNLLGSWPILGAVPKVISMGATALSPVWHFKEMMPMRGPKTFLQNTINRASAALLPELYARWPQFLRSGKMPEGHYLAPYMQLYERLAGHSQRWVTQGADPGEVIGRLPSFVQETLKRFSYPETVPRVLEMKNKLDAMKVDPRTVAGWNQAGALPDPKTQAAILNAAAEVGHNYQRAGYDVAAWNKVIPFARAHVANTSKWVRNWRDNPTGAALGVGLLVAARLAYNLIRKDDQNFQEQSVGTRGKMLGMAAPRGPDAVVDSLVDETTRWATGSNAHIGRVGTTAMDATVPGGPEPYATAARLLTNRRTLAGGEPIVPRSEEGAGWLRNAAQHQAPFAAQALTGGALSGRTPMNLLTGGFYQPGTPHQSLNDFYDRLHQVQAEREFSRRQMVPYKNEAEYQRLHSVEQAIGNLSKQMRMVSESKQAELRQRQIELARHALGR